MELSEAIKHEVEIICENEQQKEAVINVLEANNVKKHRGGGGLCVSLFRDDEYGIYPTTSENYAHLPASEFLASNPIEPIVNPHPTVEGC